MVTVQTRGANASELALGLSPEQTGAIFRQYHVYCRRYHIKTDMVGPVWLSIEIHGPGLVGYDVS